MPDRAYPNKTCFVIMPFGAKKDAQGNQIDFDDVYEHLIQKPIEEGLKIECIRCDKIESPGWIHRKMFEHVYQSDVAVVDITALNPNVFYELGVRHTLAESVTVLLCRQGTDIPFNVQGMNVIFYDISNLGSVAAAKNAIVEFIHNGLSTGKKDSPVHEVLSLKIGHQGRPLEGKDVYHYDILKAPPKQICLITGDLRNVDEVDVWVSSENTNMQMARFFDRSVSSVIRYLGAERDAVGHVTKDLIAEELAAAVGSHTHVPDGHVIPTGPGMLATTHNVKKILHAAAVSGQVGTGYRPIANIAVCVRNALNLVGDEKSILFPLMGTGAGRGELESTAKALIDAAIAYLEQRPQSQVERVYFLNWHDNELEVCQRILDRSSKVKAVP